VQQQQQQQQQQRVVPYRGCKLTHLFRDVLLGQGHLALLVAVSPCVEDAEETGLVLRYAATAAGISLVSKPPAAAAPVVATGAAEAMAAAAATAARVLELESRVSELERELGVVSGELADSQAALEEAEADVRSQVGGWCGWFCCC
jgi:hypothetical protein